ncbi:hypothetical protein M2280_005766 [Prescottella agglutinans]|jgi:hypothetical protein|uniref:Uncharacterized protein n=1 Tax=Prescottella agglutinans TaxID=1644129 RepID=A0ABT6MJL1_9NOCA|nr:hypothetical protein [Prescottella agglutinans]
MANPNRLTAQQCVDLLRELTGDEIKPGSFHSYAARGHAPKPVEKIGNTPLRKRSEIVEWAQNRPGRGARTDLSKPRRRTKNTDAAPYAARPGRVVFPAHRAYFRQHRAPAPIHGAGALVVQQGTPNSPFRRVRWCRWAWIQSAACL